MVILLLSVFIFTNCSTTNNASVDSVENGKEEPAKQIILRLAHELQEDHPYHFGSKVFAEKVAEKTNNEIIVELYPNGTLGKQAQCVEGATMGTIDIALAPAAVFETFAPMMGVYSMPYLFDSWDHGWRIIDGEIGEKIHADLERKGLKLLTIYQGGLNGINSKIPIETPSDMKSVKFRIAQSPVYVEIGKALGAVTTPMAFNEVYSALQMGAIDAQLQFPNNIRSSNHNEVAKYFIANKILHCFEPVVISKKVFDKLSSEHQKAVQEAAYESAVEQRIFATESEKEDLDYMVSKGLKIIDVDIDEWEKAVEPVYSLFPDFIEIINEVKALR